MNRRFLLCIAIGLTVSSTKGQLNRELDEELEDDSESSEEENSNSNRPQATMRVSYDGNQLWKAMVDDDNERKVIGELKERGHITTWGGSRQNLDILVKPHALEAVELVLRSQNISYEVLIRDLQTAIDEENPPIPDTIDDRKGHRMTWKAYHRANDINGFLDYLAQTYPDICRVITIGKTFEGRPIKLLKISNGNKTNKAIWIDGGIHAREWISPAAVTFIINHITSNYDNEPYYIQNVDFYIAPLLNPDGYEYTQTVDRLWRKNIGRVNPGNGNRCFGTDLNRNFGYKWGMAGVSFDRCQDIFLGAGPFSEAESMAVKKFILETKANWKAYISFHSYGQYILYPWGYTKAVPPDHKDLEAVARRAAKAIRNAGGPNYTTGPSARTLYPAAGGSDDWAKGAIHMKYSYTIELRDDGKYGFILPAQYIKDCSIDALAATRVIAEAAINA